MKRDDDELSFELLADANQRVTARLLAGLREQLDGCDIVTKFREMTGDNTNLPRATRRIDKRR
jgi:hypothetical protein